MKIDIKTRIRAGCFSGTLGEFKDAVATTHNQNNHGREYAAAIQMIEAHASIWTPTATKSKEAA